MRAPPCPGRQAASWCEPAGDKVGEGRGQADGEEPVRGELHEAQA